MVIYTHKLTFGEKMRKITVPQKQPEFKVRSGKNAKGEWKVYEFIAEDEKGAQINCQVFEDHIKDIREAQEAGVEVELEDLKHNEQFGVYQLYFKKKPTTWAGGGAKTGFSKPFVPQGFKGQTISRAEYVSNTGKVFKGMFDEVLKSLNLKADELGEEMLAAVLKTTQKLTAQYWISVEKNIVYARTVDAPAPPADTTAQAIPPADEPQRHPEEDQSLLAELALRIEESITDGMISDEDYAVAKQIVEDTEIEKVHKNKLFMKLFEANKMYKRKHA